MLFWNWHFWFFPIWTVLVLILAITLQHGSPQHLLKLNSYKYSFTVHSLHHSINFFNDLILALPFTFIRCTLLEMFSTCSSIVSSIFINSYRPLSLIFRKQVKIGCVCCLIPFNIYMYWIKYCVIISWLFYDEALDRVAQKVGWV